MLLASELIKKKTKYKVLGFPQGNIFIVFFRIWLRTVT